MAESRRKIIQLAVSKGIFQVMLSWIGICQTVMTDGVIITSTIEAHEGRDVTVGDLPNAFLNANNYEKLSFF